MLRGLLWLIISSTSIVGLHADELMIRRVIVVRGAGGTPEYESLFTTWSERWQRAALRGKCDTHLIGPAATESKVSNRDELLQLLADTAAQPVAELWIVLIGHGTFDGRTARFNFQGPDISATELKDVLAKYAQPTIVINCASSSGPFLAELAAPHRVIITATKSGAEQNFARFGEYLSAAIGDDHDLDKDGQTSLLEAFLVASHRTKQFYESEGRLETEHALLDDNGDGQGLRADWFRGLRLVKTPEHGREADGDRAQQFHLVRSTAEQSLRPETRQRRDELVREIYQLRVRKGQYETEDAYFAELERLCVELAELDPTSESGR